jgi:hypothetical protein
MTERKRRYRRARAAAILLRRFVPIVFSEIIW